MLMMIGTTGCANWETKWEHLIYHQASEEALTETIRRYIRHQKFKSALEMIEQLPAEMRDVALFQEGIVLASVGNPDRNKEQAQACFQTIIQRYPSSHFYNQSVLFTILLNENFREQKSAGELMKQNHELEQTNRVLREKNDWFETIIKEKNQEMEALQDEVDGLKTQLQQFKAIDLGHESQAHDPLSK
jgi:hypothetical protein